MKVCLYRMQVVAKAKKCFLRVSNGISRPPALRSTAGRRDQCWHVYEFFLTCLSATAAAVSAYLASGNSPLAFALFLISKLRCNLEQARIFTSCINGLPFADILQGQSTPQVLHDTHSTYKDQQLRLECQCTLSSCVKVPAYALRILQQCMVLPINNPELRKQQLTLCSNTPCPGQCQ